MSKRDLWIAALLAVAAAGLRLQFMADDLWIDELHTAWSVAGPFDEIAKRGALGNCSPLYFIVVWISTQVFGLTEFAVRLPSLLAGSLLVALVYFLVQGWTGSVVAGLLSGVLAAIDSVFIYYATEARPYALTQLTALVQLAVFWRLLWHPTGWLRIAFVFCSGLLFYLHYVSILVIAGEMVCFAIFRLARKPRPAYSWAAFAVDLAFTGLLCVPAALQVLDIVRRRANWALFVPRAPADELLTLFPLSAYVLIPLALTAAFLLPAFLLARRLQCTESLARFNWRAAAFIVCWFVVPMLAAWCVTQLDMVRIFYRRFLMPIALAPILWAGLCASLCRTRVPRWTIFVITVLYAVNDTSPLAYQQKHGHWPHRNDGWSAAVRIINGHDDRLPVFVYSGLIEADQYIGSDDALMRAYCLLPVSNIYRIRHQERLIALPTTLEFGMLKDRRDDIRRAGEAWLVARRFMEGPLRAIEKIAQQLGACEVIAFHEFGHVSVYRLRLEAP